MSHSAHSRKQCVRTVLGFCVCGVIYASVPGVEFVQVSVHMHYTYILYVWVFGMCKFLWATALRCCGEDWHWHTGWCRGIDLLHCYLQCWAAVFPMCQPEQPVEPMLLWLVWLGGKWKPLSRFFSLSHPNAKHRREVIWIAKAALAMLIWHWTISIGDWLSTCWFCFVLSCVLKWASLSTVTVSMGWCSTGWVPWCQRLVILVKRKSDSYKPFCSFSAMTEK